MDTCTLPPLTATPGTTGAIASKTILAFLLAPFLAPLMRRIEQLLFRLEQMMALWRAGALPLPAPRTPAAPQPALPPRVVTQRRRTPAIRHARARSAATAARPALAQPPAPRITLGHGLPCAVPPQLAPPRARPRVPRRSSGLERVADPRSFHYVFKMNSTNLAIPAPHLPA